MMIFEMVLCLVMWPHQEHFHCFTGVNKGSHIYIRFVCLRDAVESPEAFHFKCLYAYLSLCCQSPALESIEENGDYECSVEVKLDLEADVSALPDDVKC